MTVISTTNVHKVEKIELSDVKYYPAQSGSAPFFVRTITITTADSIQVEIRVFADNPEKIGINVEKKE